MVLQQRDKYMELKVTVYRFAYPPGKKSIRIRDQMMNNKMLQTPANHAYGEKKIVVLTQIYR